MANIVWLLKQNDSHLMYKVIGELPYQSDKNMIVRMKVEKPLKEINKDFLLYSSDYYEDLLKSYFRLNVDLEEYYKIWSKAHDHFKEIAGGKFYAIRVLNQDPIENLFSFICSQNNHISRISSLVEKLCTNYGKNICSYENVDYYSFPDISDLNDKKVESELRLASFGYRAKFIQKSAEQILEKGGLDWFKELEGLNYKEAHQELIKLTGIGPKVADCICLMSLNHLEAIPVDTHIFQIAAQHYIKDLKKVKSVTGKVYNEIGDFFRATYGEYAGWAQTVLFCADLKMFKDDEGVSKRKKAKTV